MFKDDEHVGLYEQLNDLMRHNHKNDLAEELDRLVNVWDDPEASEDVRRDALLKIAGLQSLVFNVWHQGAPPMVAMRAAYLEKFMYQEGTRPRKIMEALGLSEYMDKMKHVDHFQGGIAETFRKLAAHIRNIPQTCDGNCDDCDRCKDDDEE